MSSYFLNLIKMIIYEKINIDRYKNNVKYVCKISIF